LNGAEILTLLKIQKKCLKIFEMWCWSRKEISWIDRVKMKQYYKESRNKRKIPQTIKRRTGSWIGHILRRNCLLNHVIERMIEVTRRLKRRCKQI
jgi:hypothetical protein